jgi:transposase
LRQLRQVPHKGAVNQLKVSIQHTIVSLRERGWSARRIARELGVYRSTVRKSLLAADSRPATEVTPGSGSPVDPKPAKVTTGSGRSSCEPWRERVGAAALRGLSAKRVHQDLVAEVGFTGSYQSVKRFVRRLVAISDPPFRRMERLPGEELQIDVGLGAWVLIDGKRRGPHLFNGHAVDLHIECAAAAWPC